MMKAYSAHRVKHYNYTELLYGLCLTRTCRNFYNGSDDEADMRVAAEACLNHSLSQEYGLKTRVTELNCYQENKSKFEVDWLDWAVTILISAIVALNVLGTVYDVNRDETKPGNSVLLAFSLRRNWNQLVAPPSEDPKLVRLRPINGIRVITSILVILGHTPLPLVIAAENTTWLENAYEVTAFHTLAQGHLITQSFFLISGLLLTYNTQLYAEKKKVTLKMFPMAILNRWLRLTPINIVSLLISSTWLKSTPYGPLWQECIGNEVHDCRNYWFYNLFYINNIIDHSQCILQTWYLACDMHMHIVGLLVIILAPSAKVRWWLLGALYAVGIAWPAYNIYTMDLDPTLLASPTTMGKFFVSDPTFNYVYKRTYANLPSFIIGMVFGYLVYDWHQRKVFEKDLTKYRFIYWMLFPLLLVVTTSAAFLYCGDEPRASMGWRLVFLPVIKPLFSTLVMLIMLGAMFKIENFQRSILEWSGWMPLSRISYCIYAFHVGVLRYIGGTRTTLMHFSLSHLMHDYSGITMLTIQVALFFYLFVEVPFTHLVKQAFGIKLPSKEAVNGTAINNGTANGTAGKGTTANGTASNGTAVNGIKKNGDLNGSAVHSNGFNGAAVHATALNGSAMNGHALKEEITTGKDKDA
ncbi:hypothetical protein ABMA28_006571 [Loxostege sticticalis]|uniref:Acyltransferase 3 domain-containing protein n=1 Tax=Loxostege sticticalis TaxID=481309 RepID=A0ABD0SLN5_LOXSC